MSTYKEQIQKIQKLRNQRDQQDQELYFTKLQLIKTEQALERTLKLETQPADIHQLNTLREKISRLEQRIQALNSEISSIETVFEDIRKAENQLQFLLNKIATVEAQVREAGKNLQEEENNNIPDKKLIKKLNQLVSELNALLSELKDAFAATKKELDTLNRKKEEASLKRERLATEKGRLSEAVLQNEEELAALQNQQNNDRDEIERKRDQLKDNHERQKKISDTFHNNLSREITLLYPNRHPKNVINFLDDNIPFLMLPVRIETRFMNRELWIRIYPDDIAIHTHEKLLTDQEVEEGKKYWIKLFGAEKTGGSEKEGLKKNTWDKIASIFGPQRSAWIAKQTKPLNWSSDLAGIDTSEELEFPLTDQTKTHAWSRAPRTKVLPDKFVVMLYEGDTIVHEEVGNIIPDLLFVGPDPMESTTAFETKDGKLVFGSTFDWTSDFEKAVSLGMGFKIPLTSAQVSRGFDKILVLGGYLSADEAESKKEIEELIDNHHYSPKGFSLLRQGTSTNNTEQDGSGYSKNDLFNNTSYYVETGDPLFDEATSCDGRNLAEALGIKIEPLQYVLNSNATDFNEAVAMNKAIYPGTLGYYFETMLKPLLDDSTADVLRSFFTENVTGRGFLPSIRVGNQPYGILLTSDFSKWKWQRRERIFPASFLNTLYNVLLNYQNIWDALVPELMYVGKPGLDPSEVLMNILGLQAGSVSFHQRVGYSTDYLKNLDDFQYGGRYFSDISKSFNQKNDLLSFFSSFGFETTDDKGMLKIPQLLRLVYQHYHTVLDAANLIDNVPLSEKEKIRFYDEAAKKNYIHWLAEANSIDTLEKQNFGTGKTAPNTLLYLILRRALLLQLHKASTFWFNKNAISVENTLKAVNFHNIRPEGDLTKWEVMRAKVGVALPESPRKNSTVADFLLTSVADENEQQFLHAVKESLTILTDLPTARLERCFTEHIDLCTYRLDAWQNALFQLRLQKQRNTGKYNNGQERNTGVYLGAYGWLEDVRPAEKKVAAEPIPPALKPTNNQPLFEYTDNGGFVHTPSLNHASAAAVLRGGYLSHANSANPDMLSVNLSSERVRRALFVLQGMRNGQTLEALLGYQFERGLHDRGSENDLLKKLNLYIYDFRDAFPLSQHQIHQQGTNTTEESIPAYSVVNGVTLAEKTGTFPFGASGDVLSATAAERSAIIAEKDKLSDTLDAIKDLLLAESTYQMVQGNFDRSGAVLNSLRDAQIPPELDVIQTPRGSQFTFTTRVTLHFEHLDPHAPVNNPWPTIAITPRARMEAGLNKWLGGILGNPQDIIFKVAHLAVEGDEVSSAVISLNALNLQPIDLIYIIGNELNTGANEPGQEAKTSASELESRIAFYYRQTQSIEDFVIIRIEFKKPESQAGKKTLGEVFPLLKALKSVITDSRYIHAEDFDPPSKESTVDKMNPKGLDAGMLAGKIAGLHLSFKANLGLLDNLPILATVEDKDGNLINFTNLKDTFTALEVNKKTWTDISFTFDNGASGQLQNLLLSLSYYGVQNAFPNVTEGFTADGKLKLLEQAKGAAKRAHLMEEKANALILEGNGLSEEEKKVTKFIEAGKVLLGDAFNIIPLFNYNNEVDIISSDNDRNQLLKFASTNLKMSFPSDEWIQSISHVRQKIAKWEYVRTLSESINDNSLDLKPIQLPYRVKDTWLAVEFPEIDQVTGKPFNITQDTISVICHGNSAFTPGAKRCGLLIDDWTEMIPAKEEITGITFNYDQPNATPPQTLLLAVTPEEKGHWEWDDLVSIMNDTLARAKRRAVEPLLLEKESKPEVNVLLPAIVSDFSQYDLNISLDYRFNLTAILEQLTTLSVRPTTP